MLDNLTGDRWRGYCVNWRYITKDGQWVMVRHDRRDRLIERGGWSFIRREALNPDRRTWLGINHGSCAGNGYVPK